MDRIMRRFKSTGMRLEKQESPARAVSALRYLLGVPSLSVLYL
jgi:hypothetical protein